MQRARFNKTSINFLGSITMLIIINKFKSGQNNIVYVVDDKYNAIFNLQYQEQFYDEWYDLCKGMCYSIRDVFDDLDSTYILNNDDVSGYVPALQVGFCGNNLEPNLLL